MEEKNESIQLKYNQNVWKRVFNYFKDFKKQFLVLCAYMIALAGIDIMFPLLTRYAIDAYVMEGRIGEIYEIGIVYLLLSVALAGIVLLFIRHAGKLEMNMIYKLRKDCFQKLQKLSFSYYDKNAVGWMITRVTSDSQKISETIAWGIVDLVWGLSLMLGLSVAMLVVNWKLALMVLITIPLLAFVSVIFEKKMLLAYRKVRKLNSKITGQFNDGIVGAKTSKTLVREDLNISEFKESTHDLRGFAVKAATLSAGYLPMTFFISTIGTVLTLYYGSAFLQGSQMTYGELMFFISAARMFFDPVLELARIYTEMISAQAAGERVMDLLDETEAITDCEAPSHENSIKGDITFEHVDFFYKEGEYILKDFNLEVKAGETIALVGETGSGKSTIVNLTCRFYEPTNGKIYIDGVDYQLRTQNWLHQNMGYVLQSPHLFSGSIKENIQYGKLDASEEEIIEAAKTVGAHAFIMKLEKGYETEVGEGGSMLSTGEKQLISFARAIIGKPSIFFLDEATSSIDTESEAKIQHAITQVLKGRTSFIVAHRLSTIKNADRILVIDKGRILESGSHHELMKKKGRYYKLYTNQYVEDKEKAILSKLA